MRYIDGTLYEGQWLKGKPHGTGSLLETSQTSFSGEWSEGKKEGKGTLRWANGDSYEGQWSNDQFSGQGRLSFHNGSHEYVGQFELGNIHGKGVMKWGGNVYEGQWQNNVKQGTGAIVFCNGDKYSGTWAADRFCGTGLFERVHNSWRFEGTWVDG